QVGSVLPVDEGVVIHARGNEAGGRFGAGLVRGDEFIQVPLVADPAGICGGIDAGAPIGFGGAATGGDVLVFAGGQVGGFLDADDVVLQTQIAIDVLFALVMTEDDAGTVIEGERSARGVEFVGQRTEEALAEVLEAFEVGFANLSKEEAFEAGEALAVVD